MRDPFIQFLMFPLALVVICVAGVVACGPMESSAPPEPSHVVDRYYLPNASAVEFRDSLGRICVFVDGSSKGGLSCDWQRTFNNEKPE
jgi:hypothetical protein